MAKAICEKCGEEVHWRARKSLGLAGQVCPKCGGPLRGHPSSCKGKRRGKRIICVICGRAGFGMFRAVREGAVRRWHGAVVQVKVGDPICFLCLPGCRCSFKGEKLIDVGSDLAATAESAGIDKNEEEHGIAL